MRTSSRAGGHLCHVGYSTYAVTWPLCPEPDVGGQRGAAQMSLWSGGPQRRRLARAVCKDKDSEAAEGLKWAARGGS